MIESERLLKVKKYNKKRNEKVYIKKSVNKY